MTTPAHDAYAALLAEHRPRPIASKAMYEEALARLETLQSLYADAPTRELADVLELATMTIEAYENEHFTAPEVEPHKLVAHLLEARGMTASALADELGLSRGQMSNILSGTRGISKDVAVALGQCFSLPPSVFLGIE